MNPINEDTYAINTKDDNNDIRFRKTHFIEDTDITIDIESEAKCDSTQAINLFYLKKRREYLRNFVSFGLLNDRYPTDIEYYGSLGRFSSLINSEDLDNVNSHFPWIIVAIFSCIFSYILMIEHQSSDIIFYTPLWISFLVYILIKWSKDPLPLDVIGAIAGWFFWIVYGVIISNGSHKLKDFVQNNMIWIVLFNINNFLIAIVSNIQPNKIWYRILLIFGMILLLFPHSEFVISMNPVWVGIIKVLLYWLTYIIITYIEIKQYNYLIYSSEVRITRSIWILFTTHYMFLLAFIYILVKVLYMNINEKKKLAKKKSTDNIVSAAELPVPISDKDAVDSQALSGSFSDKKDDAIPPNTMPHNIPQQHSAPAGSMNQMNQNAAPSHWGGQPDQQAMQNQYMYGSYNAYPMNMQQQNGGYNTPVYGNIPYNQDFNTPIQHNPNFFGTGTKEQPLLPPTNNIFSNTNTAIPAVENANRGYREITAPEPAQSTVFNAAATAIPLPAASNVPIFPASSLTGGTTAQSGYENERATSTSGSVLFLDTPELSNTPTISSNATVSKSLSDSASNFGISGNTEYADGGHSRLHASHKKDDINNLGAGAAKQSGDHKVLTKLQI